MRVTLNFYFNELILSGLFLKMQKKVNLFCYVTVFLVRTIQILFVHVDCGMFFVVN